MTKQEMISEAAKLEKKIDGGKLKGKKLQKAKYRMYNLKYRAKQSAKPVKAAKPAKRGRKPKQKVVNTAQGFLPGFIEQLPMASMEEQVADHVFKALQRGVAKRLSARLGFELKLVGAEETTEVTPIFKTKGA